jgi:hypothetical protein
MVLGPVARPVVTTHVSARFGRDRRSSNLGRQPNPSAAPIALTCEVGGLRPVRTTV